MQKTTGYTLTAWTAEEIDKLHAMRAAGKSSKEIANALSVPHKRVSSRLAYETHRLKNKGNKIYEDSIRKKPIPAPIIPAVIAEVVSGGHKYTTLTIDGITIQLTDKFKSVSIGANSITIATI